MSRTSDAPVSAPFEARYSIPGQLYLLALLMVPLVPSVLYLAAGWQRGDGPAIALGALGTALFGPGALTVLVRTFDRRVRLRITADALWLPDHAQMPIPRRAIRTVRRQDGWVSLFLTKPERHPPTTLFRRLVMPFFKSPALRQQYGDVWIYPILFDCSAADLLERI